MRLLRSTFPGPVNIGSEEMIRINQLVDLVVEIAGKRIGKNHIPGPQGVRGRNSDNRLILKSLGWAPAQPLRARLEPTYRWIEQQVCAMRRSGLFDRANSRSDNRGECRTCSKCQCKWYNLFWEAPT